MLKSSICHIIIVSSWKHSYFNSNFTDICFQGPLSKPVGAWSNDAIMCYSTADVYAVNLKCVTSNIKCIICKQFFDTRKLWNVVAASVWPSIKLLNLAEHQKAYVTRWVRYKIDHIPEFNSVYDKYFILIQFLSNICFPRVQLNVNWR